MNEIKTHNNIEIAPGCLACYTQGRLTFYWYQITKDTTLEQIEQALDVGEIHKRAKTSYACGGDEVHIQDNDFCGGEYMSAKELFGYVQLLKLIPDFDYVRAFKEVYLMQDEFDYPQGNHAVEVSSMFKEYAESVQVFDSIYDLENYLDDNFMEYAEMHNTPEIIFSFINWKDAREWLLNDYEKVDMGSRIFLWRKI
tara:strand:- start:1076 stop:1666 length:591 start_codon:yes stop_codon:yes gene_type:complete